MTLVGGISDVFYVSGRLWEAQPDVFYVSERLWEAQPKSLEVPLLFASTPGGVDLLGGGPRRAVLPP